MALPFVTINLSYFSFLSLHKHWNGLDSIQGAQASAVIYSISETAKLNNLRPYYYFKHLLTELPKLCDEKGNIDSAKLNHLLPWAKELPAECRKPRRWYLLAALIYR